MLKNLTWKQQFLRGSLLLIGLVVLIGLNYLLTQRSDQRNNDYGLYWVAGHLFGHGQSPYDIEATKALQATNGILRTREAFVASVYPLWTIFLFVPLGWLEIEVAAAVWLTLNELFIAICFYLLAKVLTAELDAVQQTKQFRQLFQWGFVPFLLSFAFIHCLTNGQLSLFLTLGIVLFIYAAATERYGLAGLGLLVAIYKPTTVALFAPFALLWLLLSKYRRKGVYTFVLSAGLMVGIGFLIEPAMLSKIYNAAAGGRSDVLRLGTAWGACATLARIFGLPEILGWLVAAIFAAFCAFAGWYYLRKLKAGKVKFVAIWAFLYAYVITFSWYALSYDAVGFFPALMVAVSLAQKFSRIEKIGVGAGFGLAFYVFPYLLKFQSLALDEYRTGINMLLGLGYYLAVLAYFHYKTSSALASPQEIQP